MSDFGQTVRQAEEAEIPKPIITLSVTGAGSAEKAARETRHTFLDLDLLDQGHKRLELIA